jgi:protein TonB
MAYADQQGMSTNRIVAIVLVALLHAFIAFALISGLAYEAVKKVKERMEVVDVKEEKPPEEEPPPPPPEDVLPPPPQVVVPPPPFQQKSNNQLQQQSQDLNQKNQNTDNNFVCWDGAKVANAGLCRERPPEYKCWNGQIVKQASECPPEKKKESQKAPAVPKGNPGSWVNTTHYPSRALSQEREGTTGFRVTVGPDGRVIDCQITSSSGHADLDSATCTNVQRRARFTPAKDDDGNPTTGSYANRVRWQIPKE